ncbi:hypothetical protein BT96DRAFT_972900 [Gymnopus androsaceus JB14]|uniref:Uncharacterized protein n=1 Tax=Gymnopus androsaceus JB14 TaxID=1447944 RepID=A0A6A4HZN1_9AGAR|nr:hypothetical protein BT96DRAFT_972900 [Gymnopus androsaceus JB14]
MKLSVFGILFIAYTPVALSFAASSALVTQCGSDTTVLNSSIITHGENIITVTLSTCSAAKQAQSKRFEHIASKRQVVSFCDAPSSDCGVAETECSTIADAQPVLEDCFSLEDALLAGDNSVNGFLVPAGDALTLTFGTCEFIFENTGIEEIDICDGSLAVLGSAISATCSANPGAPLSGICFSPIVGLPWEFGVFET